MGPAEGAVVIKRWITGAEILEKYDLALRELADLLKCGLRAYDPITLDQYVRPEDCLKRKDVLPADKVSEFYEQFLLGQKLLLLSQRGGSSDEDQARAEADARIMWSFEDYASYPAPGEGTKLLESFVHPVLPGHHRWLKTVKAAVFKPDEVEAAVIPFRAARQEIDPRQRETYLTVIAALVVGMGDVGKLKDRNRVGKIVKAIERLGLDRSDDTVRKVINQVIDFMEEKKV
ncbi:MAG: hypothetical protein RDU30_00905 [Desulfovibrionaceae bacterium]|nr:hypothetical protein [Desulfovibrionaceae bacterium]